MALLPGINSTKHALDTIRLTPEYGRTYLGMSSLGEECARKLWYGFHWVSKKKLSPRKQRIFDVGHAFEAIAIKELKGIGCEVFKMVDGKEVEMTGAFDEDQETLLGFAGHESGHTDGRIRGVKECPDETLLLELKTMKDSSFQSVKKHGVEESNPTYHAQVQRYMHEKKLAKTFFLAINKDTCQYYIEIIHYNKSIAQDLVRKGREIIMSDSPPPRAYIEGYFKCWGCDHNKVCHVGFDPEVNCRTCDFSSIENNGVWVCENRRHIDIITDGRCEDEYVLSVEEQQKGCEFYKKGWGL